MEYLEKLNNIMSNIRDILKKYENGEEIKGDDFEYINNIVLEDIENTLKININEIDNWKVIENKYRRSNFGYLDFAGHPIFTTIGLALLMIKKENVKAYETAIKKFKNSEIKITPYKKENRCFIKLYYKDKQILSDRRLFIFNFSYEKSYRLWDEEIEDNIKKKILECIDNTTPINDIATNIAITENTENYHMGKITNLLKRKKQIILYGVPGTGKTYLALNYVKEKTNDDKSKYKFITFHQSYSYEDFIEGFRPKNDENGNIIYEVEDGIFKRMCILAIWEVLKDKEDIKEDINLEKKLNHALKKFAEKYPEGSILKTTKGKEFEVVKYEYKDEEINKIIIKPKNGSEYQLRKNIIKEMFKVGDIQCPSDITKKIYDTGAISYYFAIYKELKDLVNIGSDISSNNEKDLNYEYIKEIVLEKLKEHEKTKNVFKKEDFQNAPNYYLIIDEINRGNISNILGELITLLEKDKRLTEKNEIITTLPYSKEPFAVPPNLYIIGTMNTADRSIALLDIALRRRFGFLEVEPEEKLLTKDKLLENWKKICKYNEYQEVENELNKLFNELKDDEFLKNLLESINKKIVKLRDRDHRIGHSYFLKVKNIEDLKFVWFYEIIPLLMEYFYNDWESLKDILKDFVKEEKIDNETIYRIKGCEEFDNEEFIKTLKKIISKNNNNSSQNN